MLGKHYQGRPQLLQLRYPRIVWLVTLSLNVRVEIKQEVQDTDEYLRFVSWTSLLALCNKRCSMKVAHPTELDLEAPMCGLALLNVFKEQLLTKPLSLLAYDA